MKRPKRSQTSTPPPSEGVVRYLSSLSEEILALIVGKPFLYNHGDQDTLLVPCLILCSEVDHIVPGTVRNLSVVTIRSYLP